MIKAGELNQFVKDLRDKLGPKDDRGNESEDGDMYRGKAKTISRGSIFDQDSKTARKRYARQVYNLYQFDSAKQTMPITFIEDNYEDVIWPYEDPLIVNLVIGQNKIWKVLVDEGSSTTYCIIGPIAR